MSLLFVSVLLRAGVEPVNYRISGSQMQSNAFLAVQDDKYPNSFFPTQTPEDYPAFSKVNSSIGKVLFAIDQSSSTYYASDYTLKLDVEITAYDKNQNILLNSFPKTLHINYSNTSFSKDKELFVVENCHKLFVKVINVCPVDANDACITGGTVPTNIYLETEIETERYYKLDLTTPVASGGHKLYGTGANDCNDCAANEVEIFWEQLTGAEEYELEWTYVNSYDPAGGATNLALPFDFKNNSTRVRVSGNSYRISLIYDKGYVVYRIRPVGKDITDLRYETFGPWTHETNYQNAPTTLALLSSYPLIIDLTAGNQSELNKNWQYMSTFAEEGKKKEVISYFDGSLHNRQSVTKINTQDEAIVGETVYDYQGRAAISILPVPTGDNEIKYYNGINKVDGSNLVYTKDAFDKDGSSTCDAAVSAMSTVSGASQYYSPNQSGGGNNIYGPQNYTPDAEKYPFTVTRYTPDNTGRIASQSGVGPTHALGSGHETKYIYGQPEQEELDRLFAAEAGNYQHYKKNIVIDANGQASISYLDLSGKVIATALAGKPDFMEDIPNREFQASDITVKYLDATQPALSAGVNTLQNGNVLLFSKELAVSTQNTYVFNYNITPKSFIPDCLPENMCYDCVYDLVISITDECAREQLPDGNGGVAPYTLHIGKLGTSADPFSTSCVYNNTAIASPSFTLNLVPGKYTVTKSLAVNTDAADFYVNAYVSDSTTGCVLTQTQFVQQTAGTVNPTGCGITCAQCLASLGTDYNDYITNKNTNVSTQLTQAQWELEVKKCAEPCENVSPCDNLLQSMLADVRVGGQYAGFDRDANSVPVQPASYTYVLSVFQIGNYFHGSGNWRTPAVPTHYSHLLTSQVAGYYEEDGYTRSAITVMPDGSGNYIPAVVNTSGVFAVGGTNYAYPENLANFSDFITLYQSHSSWANSLVPYHPEFCYYTWCTANENTTITSAVGSTQMTSAAFDSLLGITVTFADAVTAGLISNASNADLDDEHDLANKDPYFNSASYPTSFYGPGQKSSFLGKLTNYLVFNPSNLTIKNMAAQAEVCGSIYYGSGMLSTSCSQWSTVMTNTAIPTVTKDKIWVMYRDAYLTEKQKLQRLAAHNYARDCSGGHCYNGHIGIGNTYFNPYAHDFIQYTSGFPWFPFNGCKFYDLTQPGSWLTYYLYKNKVKRFADPGDAVSGDPQDVINSMLNVAGAGMYQQTGQCPVAADLQGFLSGLAAEGKLAGSSVSLATVPEFSKKIYDQLISATSHTVCPDWDNANTFYTLNWSPSIATQTLTAQFTGASGTPYNTGVTINTNNDHLQLTAYNNFNWADIDLFKNLLFTGIVSGHYTFTVDAVDYGSNASVTPTVYQLTGITGININDCNYGLSFTPVCKGTELAGDIMTTLNGVISSTSSSMAVPLNYSTLPAITPKIVSFVNSVCQVTSTAITNGWKYDITDVSAGTQGEKIEVTLTSVAAATCTPTGTITPALASGDFAHIAYFDNLTTFTGALTGEFSVNAWADPTNSGTLTKYVLTGSAQYIDGSSVATPLLMTECDAAAASVLCTEVENAVRDDFGKLLGDLFAHNINTEQNISGNQFFTSVLSSYLDPIPTNNSNIVFADYYFTSQTLGTTSFTASIGWFGIDAGKQPVSSTNVCQFEIHFVNSAVAASQLLTITQVNNFRADAAFDDGTGVSYHFLFEDQNGNTVAGSSCFPLRNCNLCPAGAAQFAPYAEYFEGDPYSATYTVPNSTYTNLCPGDNQFSVTNIVKTDFASFCSTEPEDAAVPFPTCNGSGSASGACPYEGTGSLFTTVTGSRAGSSRIIFEKNLSSIQPNSVYNFSVNFSSGHPSIYDPNVLISLLVNGQVVKTAPFTRDGQWHYMSIANNPWNSGSATTALVQIELSVVQSYCFVALDAVQFYINGCQHSPDVVNTSGGTGPFPTVTYVDPCATDQQDLANASATGAYHDYVTNIKNEIRAQYMAKCLEAAENFSNLYNEKEFHYTLYYYDRAGNLIKTVPPEGVRPVDPADFAQVKLDRLNKTRTVFTKHILATEYEYNSLNQLVKQRLPDHDAMDIFSFGQGSGIPSGITVNQMQFTQGSSGGFLFGNDNNGNGSIFTTSDGGKTWTQLTAIGTKNLRKVQVLDASNAFVVGDEGTLLQSTDGGVTWTTITTNIISNLNDLYFTSAGDGVIVGDNGTMALLNSGGALTLLNPVVFAHGNITGISVDPAAAFTAGVSGNAMVSVSNTNGGSLYETNDGGQTWHALNSIAAPGLAKVFLENAGTGYASGIDGTLLKTSNGGASWTHLATNTTLSIIDLYSAGNNLTAVFSDGSLQHSTDGGATWANTNAGSNFKALSFMDANNGAAAGTSGLAVTTTDGGATWSAISGTPNHNYNTVHYTNFSNVPAIYFGADQSSGLIVEKYSASAWSAFTINVSGTNTNPAEDITRLIMSDAANGSFVSATGNVYYLSYQSGTSDWIAVAKLTPAGTDEYVDICTATSATTLFALTKQGLANTTNNSGSTWSSTNNVFNSATSDFTSVGFNGSNLVGVGDNGLIMDYNFSSVNDRTNNTRPLSLNDVYMDATGAAWACGQNGTVLKGTNNFGAWSFATVPSAETQNFNAILVDGGDAIVAGEGNSIVTIDANTFAVNAAYSATTEIKTDLFVSSAGDVLASAKNGVLVTLSSGGSLWSVVSGLSAFAGKDFASVSSYGSNPILAVGEAGTIARYNGSAWSSSTAIAPPSINSAYMLNSTTGYAVGNSGNIFYTNDGGVTWSNPTSPTPNNLNAIYFISPSNGFASGDAGTLIHYNGTAWSTVTSGATTTLNDIYFADATHGIIVGAAGTELITSNGGANWTSTTISSSDLNAVYMTGSMAVAVGNTGVVYRSTDYGATFSAGTSNTTENLNDVSFIDNYTGYIAGNNSVVLKTIDGGITWTNANTNLAPGTNVNTIAYGGSYQFMLGGAGAYTLNDQNDIYSTQFFFDKLGRIVASQNAKQAKILTNSNGKKYMRYSYTVYDALGRLSEVGEMNKAATGSGNPVLFNPDASFLNGSNFPFPSMGTDPLHTYIKTRIIKTNYDQPTCTTVFGFTQENLRKRVASTSIDEDGNGIYEYATHYSYDIHGHLETLLQDNAFMTGVLAVQRYKRMDYEHDLLSGNVNKVIYQGEKDQNGNYPLDRFYHKYEYDADNRITNVYTSKDGLLWDKDAKYFYYKHGGLARTETGDLKVQGTDYAYTIQSWIKSVNAGILNENADMGMDGLAAGSTQQYLPAQADIHAKIGRDALGNNLGYFANDYKPVVNSMNITTVAGNFASSANDLFNGNIRHMVTAIKNPMGGDLPVQGTAYIYDQLNRIKTMSAFRDMSSNVDNIKTTNSFATAPVSNAYHEHFDYDANGNILSVQRNNDLGLLQDDFTYQYDWVDASDHNKGIKGNRLYHVNDVASPSVATDDIDDQGSFTPSDPSDPTKINTLNNYTYDESGNLIQDKDVLSKIDRIEWTVTGKIKKIIRETSAAGMADLEFLYDAMGNRIGKIVKAHGTSIENGGTDLPNRWKTTWYVRDALGHTMAVYQDQDDQAQGNPIGFYLKEIHLYGSNRLGVLKTSPINDPGNSNGLDLLTSTSNEVNYRTLGTKTYELSNHLGNVLTVISDKKLPVDNNSNGIIDYYSADVVSATDYYAFGSPMPGRTFNSTSYKYGFNGKENDIEATGTGEGTQDYGMRIYNPALGRFLSIDPLIKKFPWYTPYQFAGNKPIKYIDLDGAEEYDPANDDILENAITATMDGVGNLMCQGFEVFVTDNCEGGVIRMNFLKQGIVVDKDVSDEQLGEVFKIRKREMQISIEFESGITDDLKDLGWSALNVSTLMSPNKVTGLLAAGGRATVLGQLYKLFGASKITKTGVQLMNVVRKFDNTIFQVGKNTNLMLDKAGLTHILARHHPNFRVGPDKAIQSLFSAATTVDDIVGTLKGITSKYGDDISKMMNGTLKDAKGNVIKSKQFEYNGKNYQLGIDPENSNRIGQFFEVTTETK